MLTLDTTRTVINLGVVETVLPTTIRYDTVINLLPVKTGFDGRAFKPST